MHGLGTPVQIYRQKFTAMASIRVPGTRAVGPAAAAQSLDNGASHEWLKAERTQLSMKLTPLNLGLIAL